MNIKEARQQFDLLLSIENGDQAGISSNHGEDISEECKEHEDELTIQAVHRVSPRKRRRDHTSRLRSTETAKMPHIMTLYDRSINLNNLTPESTLYSASREWMLNRPSQPQTVKPRHESCEDSEAESQTVLCYDCTDTSPYPECEPPHVIEGSSIPIRTEVDINTLRKMNLKRWKAVRERWQETYEQNFRAHPECVNFIKTLRQPSTPDSGSQL